MEATHKSLVAKATESVAAARRKLADDPHRPAFHFLPPAYWMNDPNGMIQWKGRYHLFYQHNPYGPLWGNMHWGHAVSDDLVHWEYLPIALAPSPNSYDKDGIYSGCAVNDHGMPTIIYTGVRPECQCIARSPDDLITWEKHPGNPVIPAPPPGFDAGFRDPYVWAEEDMWYMVVGSGRRGEGGAALLYRSSDLIHWEFMHPLFQGALAETGRMWECPFFFKLGGKYVLVVHPIPLGRAIYFVGEYRDFQFIPETRGTIDYGLGSFYATHFMGDDRGRRIMMAWLTESRSKAAQERAGWSGVMSLPRLVFLLPDGRLGFRPAPEVERLRQEHHHLENADLTQGVPLISPMQGDRLEISLRLRSLDGGALGLKLRRSPGGEEETTITYDPWLAMLTVDRQRSSLDGETERAPQVCPLKLAPEEALSLRVFVDRSVIEIYEAEGRACITTRVYPTRPDSVGIVLFSLRGSAKVEKMDVWEMKSIW